jgi:hypothetical protein
MEKFSIRLVRAFLRFLFIASIFASASTEASPRYDSLAVPLTLNVAGRQVYLLQIPTSEESIGIFALALDHKSPTSKKSSLALVTNIETQGGETAELHSVFTETAANSKAPLLFMIIRWRAYRPAVETEGFLYQIMTFKLRHQEDDKVSFDRFNDLDQFLGTGFDGTREGKRVSFRYTNAAAVRVKLRELGIVTK